MDVRLLRVQDNQLVNATLSPLNDKHLSDFEEFWKERLRASSEEDAYWDWVKKERLYASDTNGMRRKKI